MQKNISNYRGNNGKSKDDVDYSSKEEIVTKVNKAHQATKYWKELGVEGRVKLLKNIAKEIYSKKEELSLLATQEMGMPISQSRSDVDDSLTYFNWYLDNAIKYLSQEISFEDNKTINTVYYEPTGVAAVITPWNFPLSNFIWGVIPNLVVGNTVIFKHSEYTTLFSKQIENIFRQSDIPQGVFNTIYGDGEIGDFLIHQNINLICFTGSLKVGKHVYAVGAKKLIKVLLELGGSAAGIVFEDANVDDVIGNIYEGRFYNCGQVCSGLKRLLVHSSKFDEVIKKLTSILETKKIGDPFDPETDIGPLVSKKQLNLLKEQVNDSLTKGAKIVNEGRKLESLKGNYYPPTLLTNVNKNMRVWNEEVFGPVLPIITFESEEEAIDLANDSEYGLGSYIYSDNKEMAMRVASKIQSGVISINNSSYLFPSSPFGGYKNSGLGREHGKYGLHELCQIKVVSQEKI